MPILDPSLQLSLLKKLNFKKSKSSLKNAFLNRYLRVASRNKFQNFTTIEASIQFKKDLQRKITFINNKFACQLKEIDFTNPQINDYYQYLSNKLNSVRKEPNTIKGDYFIFNSSNSATKLFRPIIISNNYSWFFSDTPISILSIDLTKFNKIKDQLIQLEIDLMSAAGFSIVLVAKYCENSADFLFDLVGKNQFAEIHININDLHNTEHFLKTSKSNDYFQFKRFDGYFYLYSHFIEKDSIYHHIFKELKKMPRIYIIQFADNIYESIKSVQIQVTKPFSYCKNGFKHKNLRIQLSNIPIYNHENDSSSFVPLQASGITTCYISSINFFEWNNTRVKILIDDQIQKTLVEKYVNFEDIHKIHIDFYVKDTLALAKIGSEAKKQIDKLEKNIKEIISKRKKKKFKKDFLFSFSKEKLIENSIEYVTYAYTYAYALRFSNNEFSIHRPQIYTVLEASKILLKKKNSQIMKLIERKKFIDKIQFHYKYIDTLLSNNTEQNKIIAAKNINYIKELIKSCSDDFFIKNLIYDIEKNRQILLNESNRITKIISKNKEDQYKGVIYQVDTGEGKSCIIFIIAAILALNGKTVHIASSNIKLSNRDYMESFYFFKLLKLKSAVLLHDNELPIPPKKKSINENSTNNNNNNNTETDKAEYYTYYYDGIDYFNEEQFQNSSRMNFAVCGLDCNNNIPKNKPNIIFSTFVNFECFYLKMMEISPGYIDMYFNNCGLLIDEADSILIDEIGNGTIISREMKSNAKDILLFVYKQRKSNILAEVTFNLIKQKWPNCVDLTLKDVEKMYSEIDLVNSPEFTDGKKYSIETFEVKNKKNIKKLIKQALNVITNIGTMLVDGLIEEYSPDYKEENIFEDEDDGGDEDENEEEDEDNDDVGKTTIFKQIVPFDYDHKGILEPNKEFGGFVQQFIAIKESEKEENKNMIIKNVSMSYLYVSHPTFIKLYSKVCGFTGTIGNIKEKQIYKEQYNLLTFRIPRNKANQRVEFPMILCDSYEERNKRIVFEVLQFHRQGNPVLVIFQDLKEIDRVAYLLNLYGIHYINIFDGKNEVVRPDSIAGTLSAVSLGTNICGRGTNIKVTKKPLHVIIAYYTSNSRVINQAHGRTARQGQRGTSRIICVKDQFLCPSLINENGIDLVIEEFSIKNEFQMKYISLFKDTRPWIFSNEMTKQILNNDDIIKLREALINANRIVAYNFEFPIKMSIETFLKIQEQKIFSIYNCPNCKYTWKLFQNYIREMILESWSLMINQFDEEFFERKENKEYKKELEKLKDLNLDFRSDEYQKKRTKLNKIFFKNMGNYRLELSKKVDELYSILENYLPIDQHHIVPTFMFIYNKIINQYQNKILSSFNIFSNVYLQFNKIGFMSCQIGFKPYSLLTNSGARVTYKNYKKTNFIKDPELHYLKKTPNNRICLLSITEKIDELFDLIFQKINIILKNKTFLKLFMRRTLCGCEFGICLDFLLENKEINDYNCIIDKDPLFLFTINVKSAIPILAGVLIFLLVYVASIAKKLFDLFTNFPAKFTKEVVVRCVSVVVNVFTPELVNFALDKIIDFLSGIVNNQLENLKNSNLKSHQMIVNIIEKLIFIFNSPTFKKVNKKMSDFLGDKIKVVFDWQALIKNCFDPLRIMNISFLLLICIATFIMNFNARKDAINRVNENAKEYENSFNSDEQDQIKDEEKVNNTISNLTKKEESEINNDFKFIKQPIKDNEQQMKDEIEKSALSIQKTYLYQFKTFDISQKVVTLSEFVEDDENTINNSSNGIFEIKQFIYKGALNKKCTRMRYHGLKKQFLQQVRIYLTNEFPSILPIIGYSIHNNKFDLFVETKEKGSLEFIINKVNHIKLTETQKLIISYGIARAMKHLHKNNIIHRNLKPANIMLDSEFHPFLADFYFAKHTEIPLPYCLQETTPEFMAPEFVFDYQSIQNSFMIDVYAYGMTLFMIVSENNPFVNVNSMDIYKNILCDEPINPSFPSFVDKKWINLIEKCWNKNQAERPSFSEICTILESDISSISAIDMKSFNEYKKIFQKLDSS